MIDSGNEDRAHMEEVFKPIALRANHLGICVISVWPEKKLFVVSVNGNVAGPFKLLEIEAIRDNFNDLLEMNGQYLFLNEFDIYGREKDR